MGQPAAIGRFGVVRRSAQGHRAASANAQRRHAHTCVAARASPPALTRARDTLAAHGATGAQSPAHTAAVGWPNACCPPLTLPLLLRPPSAPQGFNCVYHVTDLPSFVSGSHLVLFDPRERRKRQHPLPAPAPLAAGRTSSARAGCAGGPPPLPSDVPAPLRT